MPSNFSDNLIDFLLHVDSHWRWRLCTSFPFIRQRYEFGFVTFQKFITTLPLEYFAPGFTEEWRIQNSKTKLRADSPVDERTECIWSLKGNPPLCKTSLQAFFLFHHEKTPLTRVFPVMHFCINAEPSACTEEQTIVYMTISVFYFRFLNNIFI